MPMRPAVNPHLSELVEMLQLVFVSGLCIGQYYLVYVILVESCVHVAKGCENEDQSNEHELNWHQ